jgi:hypothetical protein
MYKKFAIHIEKLFILDNFVDSSSQCATKIDVDTLVEYALLCDFKDIIGE